MYPKCRLVYVLLGLRILLVGGLPPPCPPPCQCYDTSKVFCSEERMREIPAGLPGIATQLFFLEVSGNPLAAISPGVLVGLPSLTKLSLGANAIRTLQPGLFATPCRLQDLRLPGNKIEELPPGIFHPLWHLQSLDLSQNALAELPDGLLAPLAALRLLKLSDNLLHRRHMALGTLAPDIFASLPNLTVLSLEGNRLAKLPTTLFTSTPHLLHLSLARNQLETLPQGLFANLSMLQTLELARVGLADNPWACVCRLAYLLGWLQSFAEPLTHAQASCTSPAALQGRSLLEVPQRQLECPGAPGVPPEEGWHGDPGEDALGQCTYSNPEGTVSVACDATSCQQLSLRLPPPPPRQVSGAAFQGTWVLRSRCGTLQVSVLVMAQPGDEATSPTLPTAP
ncbi:PREDICTED: carboxypeptidase N subunit 2-like [Eurypyga helias]|uniref:carboxypeptidase N subunit 2-like n=1 Tax=Eurypyga helias TaxID=54383 RepID=UPI00052852D1|nr:PREDICTED: carboxypeptidase N subunit 2-like [Eurypyga helias]